MTFRGDALAGQHIVISGGCGAIGVGVVKALTDHGAVMTVNDIVAVAEGEQRLRDAGVSSERCRYVQGDLTQADDVVHLLEAARTRFGPVHTALCHLGMVLSKPILDVEPEEWDQVMAVNVRSAFMLAKAAANGMLADGINGHLVFTTSWVASVPWPGIAPYSSSKAAMNQLMRSFARELAPSGIRANCLSPGIVGVGMAKRQWDTEPDYRARASRAVPLGELQTVESVADAFLFLCSPAARYMTGAVLLVDGGCSLYPMD